MNDEVKCVCIVCIGGSVRSERKIKKILLLKTTKFGKIGKTYLQKVEMKTFIWRRYDKKAHTKFRRYSVWQRTRRALQMWNRTWECSFFIRLIFYMCCILSKVAQVNGTTAATQIYNKLFYCVIWTILNNLPDW